LQKNKIPFPCGTVHFVGIGGIGMSGIAEIMHSCGYNISGSDIADNANVQRLRAMGIKVNIGHNPENVKNVGVVVVSSAISPDNPEVAAARELKIPVIHRSDMLAELMKSHWSVSVGGTHGKTTTTALISWILEQAGKEPTIINGGIINSSGTNAVLGKGDWMVVEADESDGSFVKFPSTLVVVTNIDPDHMNFYKDIDDLKNTFTKFINNIPFYGLAVICIDSPEVQKIIPDISRPFITYGFNRQADISVFNVLSKEKSMCFDVAIKDRNTNLVQKIEDFSIPLCGEHNVKNALAAIGVALKLNIDIEIIKKAIASFTGVKRRFTKIDEVNGISFFDDYAHHPTEIKAVLKGARNVTTGKIIAVFQPHRYTRLRDLFLGFCTAFNDADMVIVTDVYSAGEEEIANINKETIKAGIAEHGHRNVKAANSFEQVEQMIQNEACSGDTVIFLGAGSISANAYKIVKNLREKEAENF
jgi:UDP-N-acetylmuramate--alanine ligase